MRQTVLQNAGSKDLDLLRSFSARALASPGIVTGLSRDGKFNLIIALHDFTGHFSDLSGDCAAAGKLAARTLN